MDFMNRGFRGNQPNTPDNEHATTNHVAEPTKANKKGVKKLAPNNLSKAGKFIFLILIVLLVAAAFTGLIFAKGGSKEETIVDSSKYQAVFLNGGQVYFGKVNELNGRYIDLANVYYLRVNQQVQPDANASANNNDISLVKLGCELHGPTDRMVINRDQVIFWENLKGDGQVVKAIDQYKQQYPDGQKCDEQNANSTSTNANQNSSTNNSSTNSNSANKPSSTSTNR